MNERVGTKGLIFNEPLPWEKGAKGRSGYSLPRQDVPTSEPNDDIQGSGPDFPDLGELDVIRHFTRLSQWNFGVDSGMYPLPKIIPNRSVKSMLSMATLEYW